MESDIAERIRADFPSTDVSDVIVLLEEAGRSEGRIARCIVVASAGDLQALRQYIEMAKADSRDVIVAGEYSPGLQQLRDLRTSFLIDAPEKFWIGEVATTLQARGFTLRLLDSGKATVGPFEYTADESEGVAEFEGKPAPITIEKTDRRWKIYGDPADLELYDLNQQFDDESRFRDAVSSYILAKQRQKTLHPTAGSSPV